MKLALRTVKTNEKLTASKFARMHVPYHSW